ncbi:MAG: thiamine-phosphate kinase [Acidobacteriota bacterium]|nr:thiamine-phosphate kinase [Acidobacteriota bacterium]
MTGEFDFVRSLLDKTARNKSQFSPVKIGIGDDCAVISQNSKTDLVITTDLLIEDIDFRLGWTRANFVGHKALAVSLSDVAAMGAKPLWALVSIGIPEKIWKTDFVEKFYVGWLGLAKKFNVELAGGDVSRTPDKIVIDSIVAGGAKKNLAVVRSGAEVGDLIFVTGKLGGAAAGLRLLENSFRFDKEKGMLKNLIRRQLAPNPQIEIGCKLSENKLATAMLDLSDGLSSDLAHLCQASKVGARIVAERIPLEKKLGEVLKENEDEISFALNGGEDFELLFTARPKNKIKLEKLFGEKITCIGEITAQAEKIELVVGSKTVSLSPGGFRHF